MNESVYESVYKSAHNLDFGVLEPKDDKNMFPEILNLIELKKVLDSYCTENWVHSHLGVKEDARYICWW
jgi:hypothetical protein